MEREKPANDPGSALAPVHSMVFMRNCAVGKDDDTCVGGKVYLHFHLPVLVTSFHNFRRGSSVIHIFLHLAASNSPTLNIVKFFLEVFSCLSTWWRYQLDYFFSPVFPTSILTPPLFAIIHFIFLLRYPKFPSHFASHANSYHG